MRRRRDRTTSRRVPDRAPDARTARLLRAARSAGWRRAVRVRGNATNVGLDVVREAIETNVLGARRTTPAFLPLLRRSAHPRVVMVGSESGSLAAMGGAVPAYAVSKAALNALARTLAGDLRRDRVLVNAVCPGWTATDMGGRGGRARRRRCGEHPVGRRPARRRPDGHGRPLRW